NYNVTTNTATGTITPADLAINAVTDSKVYDGTTASAGTVSVGALFGSDSVTGTTQAFDSKDVLGANSSTLNVTGYTVNDGNGGANYNVTTNTATGTITPAALDVTANNLYKSYGATDPTLTYTYSGLVGVDTTADALSGSLTRALGEVTGLYAITHGSLTSNNYSLAFTPGSLRIVPLVEPAQPIIQVAQTGTVPLSLPSLIAAIDGQPSQPQMVYSGSKDITGETTQQWTYGNGPSITIVDGGVRMSDDAKDR
ncbi:MAG: MBG domain-containing protein, partial [Gallionella sp.]